MKIIVYGDAKISETNHIEQIVLKNDIKAEIVHFDKNVPVPYKTLKEIVRERTTNLYIIYLNSEADMILAQEIRKYDYNGNIVFITVSDCFALQVIKSNIKPLDYIDDQFEKIEKSILTIYKEYLDGKVMEDKPVFFTIKDGYTITWIPCHQINFIETLNRKIYLFTDNERYQFPGTITDLYKQLSSETDYLFSCHRAYIVNINKIVEVSKELIYVGQNRIDIPLTRLKRKELLDLLLGVDCYE